MRPPGVLRSSPSTIRSLVLPAAPVRATTLAALTVVVFTVVAVLTLVIGPAGANTQEAEQAVEDSSSIGGRVVDAAGQPATGLTASLNTAALDGTVQRMLGTTFTDDDGRYRFDDLEADCYLVVFEATPGTSFEAASPTTGRYVCLDPGQSDLTVDGALTAGPPGQPGQPFVANVIHIGDHHSHLLPRTITVELQGEPTEIEIGGMARVATVMSERSEALGRESTVLINSGGSLGGTIFHSVFGGAADAAVLNTICFDLVGLGADDLTHHPADLEAFLDFLTDGGCRPVIIGPEPEAKQRTGPDGSTIGEGGPVTEAKPVHAVAFDQGVVGFVSVGQPGADRRNAPAPEPEFVAQIQSQIDRLASLGVNNIILLSTIGLADDLVLVTQLSGVDGVVGGGSHSLLGDFAGLGLAVEGRYPVEVENLDGDPVCIGHAWQYASVVGELRLGFDGQGRLDSCGGEAHLLLSTIAEDPGTKVTVDGYVAALSELAAEPLATVTDELCFTAIPSRSVGLLCSDDVVGDGHRRPADIQLLIATALRQHADIGIVNSGIVDRGLGVGTLRIGDAYGTLAREHGNRDDSVHLLRMTGAELAATLEQAVEAAVGKEQSRAAYPYVAGLRWSYDRAAPLGRRIIELQVESVDGEPTTIDPEAIYTVATTGYLAFGGDGYRAMADAAADGRAFRTGIEYPDALLSYIENDLEGHIAPPSR